MRRNKEVRKEKKKKLKLSTLVKIQKASNAKVLESYQIQYFILKQQSSLTLKSFCFGSSFQLTTFWTEKILLFLMRQVAWENSYLFNYCFPRFITVIPGFHLLDENTDHLVLFFAVEWAWHHASWSTSRQIQRMYYCSSIKTWLNQCTLLTDRKYCLGGGTISVKNTSSWSVHMPENHSFFSSWT